MTEDVELQQHEAAGNGRSTVLVITEMDVILEGAMLFEWSCCVLYNPNLKLPVRSPSVRELPQHVKRASKSWSPLTLAGSTTPANLHHSLQKTMQR